MILQLSNDPGHEWDHFASQYSGLVFHLSVWGHILREAFNGDLYYYYLEKDGNMVCGLPGIVIDLKLLRVLFSIISYGSVIGEPQYIPTFIELFNHEVVKHQIHQVKIHGHPGCTFESLTGFKTIQGFSHILNIDQKNEIEIQRQYSNGTRRDIRKAERLGIKVRSIQDRSEVSQFYQLYLASMSRKGVFAKYPEKFFYMIYDHLLQTHKADYLFACFNDQVVAGICLLYSTEYAHYFMAGSLPEFLRLQPNELLLHHAITVTIDRKLKYFDFMGSPPHDKNLIRFKEKWGSSPIIVNTYVRSLHKPRCTLWNLAQRIGQTRLGSRLYGFLSNRS